MTKSIAHHCHWPGCTEEVPPRLWGCKKHWYTLPKALRDRIWAAYRPGQEISKTPSAEYLAVAHEAQKWCLAYEARKKNKGMPLLEGSAAFVEPEAPRPPYEPIPVDVAGCVGKKFAKSQVIILAWDPVHQLVHSTTWGREPEDKILAARGGEKLVALIGGLLESRETFEDFRLDAYRGLIERLLDAGIGNWHKRRGNEALPAWLGLTDAEYKTCVEEGLDGLLRAVLLAAKPGTEPCGEK